MDLDQTQALDLGEYDDEIGSGSAEEGTSSSKKVVAHLKVFSHTDFSEKVFPLYEGENDIGRGENCCVFIPLKALSKQHAVIDVKGGLHLIYDCESKNRTRKEKVFLQPKIRYELKHGDMLTLADIRCQYLIGPLTEKSTAENESETGSETGSESMLPTSQDEEPDFGKITAALEEVGPKEEKEDLPTNGKVSPTHPVVKHKEEGLSTEEVYAADTEDETDDDDEDDDVPFYTPGRPAIKGSDDEEEEKQTDNNGQNSSAANLPVVTKLSAKGAVDSEKTGEESEKPGMKLLFESESDDNASPTHRQPLPQTPGYDDSTDDEQHAATVKKAPLVKQQISGEGETLAFGLGTPEDIIRPRESQKTQSIEATLPVSPDSPERSSSPTALPCGREKLSEAVCTETLVYGSDEDGLASTADRDDTTKDTSATCPATLIYRSDEEEDDPNGDESRKQPVIGGEKQLRDSDEEPCETSGTTDLKRGTAKDVGVCGPTLVYTSGEETPASSPSEGEETFIGEKVIKSSPEKKGEEGVDEAEEGGEDKGEDQGAEEGIEEGSTAVVDTPENTDPVDADATQVYNLDDDSTDDEDLMMAATQAYKPATRGKQAAAQGEDDTETQAYDDDEEEDEENRSDEDLMMAATQAYEPATRRKQTAAEGEDDMATQAYDDEDEENRIGEDQELAATQAYQTTGASNQATQAYGADDTETQAYDDENEDETNNMETTLAYGAGVATQPFAAQDERSGERKGTGAGIIQEDLQQTLAYGVPDVEETQAYGAGVDVQAGAEAFEESSADEVCEATQAYGFDDPARHPQKVVEDEDDQSKPSTTGRTIEVEIEVVPDSQDTPVTPIAQEKEVKKERRVTFAEVNEADEEEVESSEEPVEIPHTTQDEHVSKTRKPVTMSDAVQEMDDSEEDFVRPKRRGGQKPPAFLDSQESADSEETEKEDVPFKDVPSRSSLTAGVSSENIDDLTVEEPQETTATTKRISRRGTKKPYVEIIQVTEPEKAQGRRTRGKGAKQQESAAGPSTAACEEPTTSGTPSRGKGQGKTRGRHSKAVEPTMPDHVPEEGTKSSSTRGKRGQGRQSQLKAAEPSESVLVPEEVSATSPVRGSRDKRQLQAAEPTEVETIPEDVPASSTVKGKKGRGKQSKAAKLTESEVPPDDISESSTAKDKKGRGRQSKAAEPTESEVPPNDIPESSTTKDKKGRGRQSKAAEPTEENNLSGSIPETSTARNKKGRGKQSKAAKPPESEVPPDDVPETLTAKDKKGRESEVSPHGIPDDVPETLSATGRRGRGRQSKAAEPSEPVSPPDDVPDTSSATGRRGRGRQSKAAEPSEPVSPPDDVPETSSATGRKGRGRQSKAAEPSEPDTPPDDVPETSSAKGKRGQGRQSKAKGPTEHESLPEDVPQTVTPKGKRGGGRQSKAAEPTEPGNALEGVSKASPVRGRRSRGRQSKAAEPSEPESVPEDVPETSTQRSRRGRQRQPKTSMADELMDESPASGEVPQEHPDTATDTGRAKKRQVKPSDVAAAAESTELADELSTAAPSSSPVKVRGRGRGKQAKVSRPSTSRAVLEQIPTDEDAEEEPAVIDIPPRRRGRGKGTSTKDDSNIKDREESEPEPSSEPGPSKRRGRQSRAQQRDKGVVEESETPDSSQTLSLPDASSESMAGSQESGTRKGRGRKRQVDQSPEPQAQATPTKRGRKQVPPSVGDSPSLRQRKPGDVKPRVMFTGLVDKRGEKIVTSLGGELVDSVYSCTHLVTDKVRRTVKFLCGVASGQVIVLPSWLDACNKAKAFVDSRSFFVKDKDAEKQYKFSLERSHERAVERGLLDGYKIHVTAHVKPESLQMKDIVKCAKGEFLPRVPRQAAENLLVISCEEDRLTCQPCLTAGIPVYTAELLLTGILKQELDLHEHRLFTEDEGGNETSAAGGKKRGHDTSQGGSTSATPRGSKRRKR